jgi:tetratricopeptide (TPR) repeat protein
MTEMLEVLDRFQKLKLRGDLESAERLLTGWATGTGEFADMCLAFSALHLFALDEGRLDKAYAYARELVALDGEDPFAHDCIARVHRLRGDLLQAEKESRRAMDLASGSEDPMNVFSDVTGLAEILLLQDRLDECEALALSEMEEAARWSESHPSFAFALAPRLRLLGRLYRRRRDYARSIDYFRRASRVLVAARKPLFGYDELLEELVSVIRECETHRATTTDG